MSMPMSMPMPMPFLSPSSPDDQPFASTVSIESISAFDSLVTVPAMGLSVRVWRLTNSINSYLNVRIDTPDTGSTNTTLEGVCVSSCATCTGGAPGFGEETEIREREREREERLCLASTRWGDVMI